MAKHQKARRVRAEGFRPTGNIEHARVVALRRRSGAATPHDSRPRRQRTRAAVKRAAMVGY